MSTTVTKSNKPNRVNNFDLLRILAALQVVFHHGMEHLKIENEILSGFHHYFLRFFPGVPIFFFISGFLIYWSFERNKDKITNYFKNRLLRLFPALWVCFVITLILILNDFEGDVSNIALNSEFYVWVVGQISFFQFYTPDVLRFWGVGTPNGSLWTIIVELQFYFLLPVILFISKRNFKIIYLFFILSIVINFVLREDVESNLIKLLRLNIFPYLYYFLFGSLFYVFWDKIKKHLENKMLFWLCAYVLFYIIVGLYFEIPFFDYWIYSPIKLVGDLLLICFTASFAYTNTSISNKILKGNDISYGVYIYHMLVVNFLVQRELLNKPVYLLITFIATIFLAFLSWRFIEKPSLKLKYKKIKIFNKTF